MSTERKQSAIQEVRDQLSLDYADSRYLNIVGSNLGLTKPRIGFSDDSWRAIVKVIALHYKQIKTKFEELLAIFFGPRITVDSGLVADVFAGQKVVKILDHTDWPQLGTVIFDEGLATEETKTYCFIDRTTREMYLTQGLEFPHTATLKDAEQPLIAIDEVNGNRIVVISAAPFPAPVDVGNYTIVIGAGTLVEETVVVTGVDYVNRVITLSAPLVNVHAGTVPSVIKTIVGRTYNPVHPVTGLIQEQGVPLLTVTNAHRFPPSGDVLVGAAGPGAAPTNDVFVATGGSTTTVNAAIGTFETGGHSGNRIVFANDTATGALRGVEATIVTNTGIQLVLNKTLPAAVAGGDTFRIRAHVHYTSIDYDTNSLVLSKHIPNLSIERDGVLISNTVDIGSTVSVVQLVVGGLVMNAHRGRRVSVGGVLTEIVSNNAGDITVLPVLPVSPSPGASVKIFFDTEVELMEPVVKHTATGESVDVAQVKSQGKGWDVIQTNPNCVEIFVPKDAQDLKDLRSASYLHTTHISPPPATTLAFAALAGDTFFIVTDPTGFPVVGVVSLSAGVERVAYHNLVTYLPVNAFSGDVTLQVPNSANFPDTGDIIIDLGGPNQETVTISANDPATNTLTISALVNDHLVGTTVRDLRFIIPNGSALIAAHGALASVNLYQPPRGTTELLDGNMWTIEDVFAGPYIYKPDELTWGGFGLKVFRTAPASRLPGVVTPATTNTKLVPGPVQISIDQTPGKTAIEVEDATAFELAVFPYTARTGINTGNQERLIVNDVNLRQRTFTTVAVPSVVGAISLEITALSPTPAIPASSFPDAKGYRVLIGKGLATEEVAYVLDTLVGPDTLVFEMPLTQAHVALETVELLSDVLTVVTTADAHDGIISGTDRSTASAAAAGSAQTARWPAISSTDRLQAELVAQEISEITLNSVTNFATNDGRAYLNFGKTAGGIEEVIPFIGEARTTLPLFATSFNVPNDNPGVFPLAAASALTPFVVVIDPGGLKEEVARVVGSMGPGTLVLETALRFGHPLGTLIRHVNSKEELLTYTSIVGSTLRFSPPIVLQFTHSPGETAISSLVESVPSLDGYDFPFYLPPDLSFRLQAILDLVRAAGVAVKFIDKR
jgi:hypothetical protein